MAGFPAVARRRRLPGNSTLMMATQEMACLQQLCGPQYVVYCLSGADA